MDERELAKLMRVSVTTVRRWRQQWKVGSPGQKGPRFLKFGAAVRYSRADVDEWIESLQSLPPGRADRDPADTPHGTLKGYQSWGCRCPLCVEQGKRYNRSQAELAKARVEDKAAQERLRSLLAPLEAGPKA